MEYLVDAKSGIRYQLPEGTGDCKFYVWDIRREYSEGFGPRTYCFVWHRQGPFNYADALKYRKRCDGTITEDPEYGDPPELHHC